MSGLIPRLVFVAATVFGDTVLGSFKLDFSFGWTLTSPSLLLAAVDSSVNRVLEDVCFLDTDCKLRRDCCRLRDEERRFEYAGGGNLFPSSSSLDSSELPASLTGLSDFVLPMCLSDCAIPLANLIRLARLETDGVIGPKSRRLWTSFGERGSAVGNFRIDCVADIEILLLESVFREVESSRFLSDICFR